MWWIILGVVLVVIVVIMALCRIAGLADRRSEVSYLMKYRGDNDEDN